MKKEEIPAEGWIRVSERLPKEGQQVWTWFGDMAFAIYEEGKWYEGSCFGRNEYNENITHWMPLPPKPLKS